MKKIIITKEEYIRRVGIGETFFDEAGNKLNYVQVFSDKDEVTVKAANKYEEDKTIIVAELEQGMTVVTESKLLTVRNITKTGQSHSKFSTPAEWRINFLLATYSPK